MDQTPLLRDNYFSFPTAKHILAVPLFIQNQLAGVICMQGSLLRFSSSVKSHVELLATWVHQKKIDS
jgi:GAF domain-containing protein